MAAVKGEREERAPPTDSPLHSKSPARWRGSAPQLGLAPEDDRQRDRCRGKERERERERDYREKCSQFDKTLEKIGEKGTLLSSRSVHVQF